MPQHQPNPSTVSMVLRHSAALTSVVPARRALRVGFKTFPSVREQPRRRAGCTPHARAQRAFRPGIRLMPGPTDDRGFATPSFETDLLHATGTQWVLKRGRTVAGCDCRRSD